jgi:hypothetical protein
LRLAMKDTLCSLRCVGMWRVGVDEVSGSRNK